MALNAASLSATAHKLLLGAGQDVSIRRAVDSGDSWNPTITTADYATVAYFADYRAFEVDGTLVLATDRRAYASVSPLAIVPDPRDRLIVGGDDLAIVSVKTFNVAGSPVLYELQVRA